MFLCEFAAVFLLNGCDFVCFCCTRITMESHDSGGDKADYWDGPLPRSLVLGQLPWFFFGKQKTACWRKTTWKHHIIWNEFCVFLCLTACFSLKWWLGTTNRLLKAIDILQMFQGLGQEGSNNHETLTSGQGWLMLIVEWWRNSQKIVDHDFIGTIIEVFCVFVDCFHSSNLSVLKCEKLDFKPVDISIKGFCPLAKGLSYFLVFGGCAMMIRVFYIAAHNVTGRGFFHGCGCTPLVFGEGMGWEGAHLCLKIFDILNGSLSV